MTFISNAPYNTLFIIYLLISCNFLANLFSCNLQELLTNNMYAKHMFGFLAMLFCIIYVDSTIVKESKYIEGFFYAVIFYIWFVLTTKTHLYTTLIIFILILIVYILQIYKNTLNQELEKEQKDISQEQEKLKQEQELEQDINNVQLTQHIIIGSALVITIIGSIYYYFAKKKEYSKDWDALTFIFGNIDCKNNKDGVL